MAETKTQSKSKTQSKKAKGRSNAKPRKAAKPRKRSASKPKAASKPASSSKGSSGSNSSKSSKPQAVLHAVEETAKDAGGAVGNAAGKVGHAAAKAKVPLMAGSAALAGIAGGIALGNRQTHRHHNGIAGLKSKDLAKAAKKAGGAGLRVGELALEGRRAREARNGNGGAHRSPVEVVLQGLTSRR
ncbi:MAG TPA: hypothetical protein VFX85_00825 [Solirubrobacterales bacterium]|nr:hypothetical protein [Solirubrobacterales bacterium]